VGIDIDYVARGYEKTGVATPRDRIRCPCCGWIVPAGRLNQGNRYDLGIFTYWFCGKGDIRFEKKRLGEDEVRMLKNSLIPRLKEVLGYLGYVEMPKIVPVEQVRGTVGVEQMRERISEPMGVATVKELRGRVAVPVAIRVEW